MILEIIFFNNDGRGSNKPRVFPNYCEKFNNVVSTNLQIGKRIDYPGRKEMDVKIFEDCT